MEFSRIVIKSRTEPPRNILSSDQLDGLLKSIDTFEFGSSPNSDTIAVLDTFAVFSARGVQSHNRPHIPNVDSDSGVGDGHLQAEDLCTRHIGTSDTPDDTRTNYLPRADTSIRCSSVVSLQDVALSQPSNVQHSDSANIGGLADNTIALTPSAAQSQASETSDEDWLHNGGISAVHSVPYPNADLELFLMRHYTNRVCHLFCAIDTVKSPWKTIHLPRALQGMSELSVTGKTSRIRKALQKALLSVSAWYLSNDHGRHDASDAADAWARTAAMYGFDAIALLKQAVEFDLYCAPRPKYKEFLATMLSMITVNVSKFNLSSSSSCILTTGTGHVWRYEHLRRSP